VRLLICHNEYAAVSGEEHALQAIAGILVENGHSVDWFLRSSGDIHGITGKIYAFFSGIHSRQAAKDLHAVLEKNRPDAVLVQNLYPFVSPSVLPVIKRFNIPIIMRCPNYRLFCPNGLHLSKGRVCEKCLGGKEYWCVVKNCENNLLKSLGYAMRNAAARITRRIVDNVDLFLVLSEFQKQRFMAGGIVEDRLKILPNMVPVKGAEPSDEPGDLVSFVGRISPEKGIEDFLAAAKNLPDIQFAVAGNFEQMPGVRVRAPDNVQWKGFLRGEDLVSFYRQSRILVFPGKWFEGFPNVITSAMAAGKPVIASRLGAVPEIVDDKRTGLLFPSGNVTALSACIRRLYDDPDECSRLGQAGRQKAETRYSREAVYEILMDIVNCACSRVEGAPRR
jgi:glycosyltransferase involved in cell wall biosynthesis